MMSQSDMNPVQAGPKKVTMGSPFFPPPDVNEKAKMKVRATLEAEEEEEEPPEPPPDYSGVPSLLLPLRKFSFAEKHKVVSYAPDAPKPSGSAVKIVEEVKAKVIADIPIKPGKFTTTHHNRSHLAPPYARFACNPGMRKSRLQRLLDVFPLDKITPFLTTKDVYNLNLTSFYFHTRVYELGANLLLLFFRIVLRLDNPKSHSSSHLPTYHLLDCRGL
jgi:hypothetical protein